MDPLRWTHDIMVEAVGRRVVRFTAGTRWPIVSVLVFSFFSALSLFLSLSLSLTTLGSTIHKKECAGDDSIASALGAGVWACSR